MKNNRTRRVRMTESDLRRLVKRVIKETNHSKMDKMEMADMDMKEMGVYGFKHHKGHSDQGYLDREGDMLGGRHGHEDDEMSMKTRERMSRGTRKFDMGETVSMDDMDEMYMKKEGMGHKMMDEMSDEDMVEMMKRSEMKEKYHARKAMKERMKKEKMEEAFRRSLRRRR